MFNKFKIFILLFILLSLFNQVNAKDDFFEEAKKKFDEKKIEDSKFLFQKNIVYNPKNAISSLSL